MSGDIGARIVENMQMVCKLHGGPRQYLQHRVGTADEAKAQFYDALVKLVPPDDTVAYHTEKHVPATEERNMGTTLPSIFHPSHFAWSDESSMKGHPEACIAVRLTEEFVKDGFITSSEPLLITLMNSIEPAVCGPLFPAAGGQALDPFSLGFVKGSARVTTLLCILRFFIDDGVSLQEAANVISCHPTCDMAT